MVTINSKEFFLQSLCFLMKSDNDKNKNIFENSISGIISKDFLRNLSDFL